MNGQCLCQKIKISVPTTSEKISGCYCDWCRKWSNGAFLCLQEGYSEDAIVEGKEFLQEFMSSKEASRTFCKNCGTNISFKYDKHYFNVGLFDDRIFKVIEQPYSEEKKPDYLK